MLHKRKRSANILSSPSSDSCSSSTNTVQSFYPHTKPIPSSPFHNSSNIGKELSLEPETPSHLNIRTRKRHRDNRPDASSVHGASSAGCWLGAVIHMRALADVSRVAASTIQRLYQAQQRVNAAAENGVVSSQQQSEQQQSIPQHTVSQKSTLHSFWRIEQPVPVLTAPQAQHADHAQDLRCEDCDGALKSEDAMDVDEVPVEDKACGSCRRPICDGCAIYGRERVCAGCAGCERGW